MNERWAPVVGYEEFYEVSDRGRLRAHARTITTTDGRVRTYPPRDVNGWTSNTGYTQVSLSRDGRKRKESLHVLVLEAFRGPRPSPRHVTCHADGTRTNNHLENLRWDTQSENLRDAVRHGTHHWAAKTECPQGHPYSPENTYVYKGRRACRACNRPRLAAYKRQQRALAKESAA